MQNYKFLKKGTFENLEKYEKRLNEAISSGWRVVNYTDGSHGMMALLQRDR